MAQKKMQVPTLKSEEEARAFVIEHARRVLKFKEAEKVMNGLKERFNLAMLAYFIDNVEENSMTFEGKFVGGDDAGLSASVTVTKVTRTKIIWDVQKLTKAVGKKLAKKVIKKTYKVNDMQGLTAYLKECGVDPLVFKSFITVDSKVDEDAIDRLEALGKIDGEKIEACCSVEMSDPYFRIAVKKDVM